VFGVTPIRERNPVVVGVVGIVVLAVVALLAFYSDDLPLIGGGTSYSADFTESAGLVSGNEVRVAGVKVGKVTGVSLAGNHVRVTFKVKDTWVGNASTAAIRIKTLLGEKYLAIDPLGAADQNPDQDIPSSRTVSPYDVTDAFNGLANTIGQIDTRQLAQSFQAISNTFADTPPELHQALTGLSALSETISSRDDQLAQLLANTKQITATLAGDDSQFQQLLSDGNLLLSELRQRRDTIGSLLTGTEALAKQLSGLVDDNNKQLGPTLTELDQVTTVLQRNQDNLNKALSLAGPYYRMVGNTLGNGRWLDAYVCGLIPQADLAPGAGPSTGCEPPKQSGGT
jgi:phospholipid/cholesterol/gamma-HCH transport system substrate-binding protein